MALPDQLGVRSPLKDIQRCSHESSALGRSLAELEKKLVRGLEFNCTSDLDFVSENGIFRGYS
jgi:hypothetical protein